MSIDMNVHIDITHP